MDRRKYELNKKIKKDVDKNQVEYRETDDEPIKFIKRVNIYITDKRGSILTDVKISFDEQEIIAGRYGLLISQFPNKETEITAEKEGYKSATAQMILDAKIQTHEFYLALEESDEESEVISTDETIGEIENKGFTLGDIIFNPPLDGSDEITAWAGTNTTHDGIYDAHGSILSNGWSNEGLWQLEYDVAYSGKNTVLRGYVGVITMCTQDIVPYSAAKENRYGLETWEGEAYPHMIGAQVNGPTQYAYENRKEYHHAILRKVSETELEYEFDGNIWYYTIEQLPNFETLYIGARNNPFSPNAGENIYFKNIIVYDLLKDGQSLRQKENEEDNGQLQSGSITPPTMIEEDEESFF